MGTLFDYVKWRGDLSFTEAPFNEVDSLIFSLISYVDFDGIVSNLHGGTKVPIKAAANSYFTKNPDMKKISVGLIVPKDIVKLFRALKDCRRFRNVELSAYVNHVDLEEQTQFSAITVFPGDGTMVIAYRGTDDTIVGWKENFNMSFLPVVPAQAAAADYLNQAAKSNASFSSIRLTGHSKGGNLAVFAAVNCAAEVKKRLINVWSNDGPGFNKNILEDEDYIDMRHMIKSFVPENAVVGMLLEHDENYTVVKSRQKGMFQHDGVSWEVMGGSFVYLKERSNESKRLDKVLKEWVREMSPEQREQFTDALFQILSADNALTLTELVSIRNKWLAKGKKLDPHVHKTIQKTVTTLIGLNTKTILSDLFPPKENSKPQK
ncbi:MAG: DUF2974 domain-containing protein [Ruminococcaceae bacterium]|nr:DUF2974 domain-containing protein [Oscillospiraceae bacterium]